MRFPQVYVHQAESLTAALPISGAAPQTVAGNTLDAGKVGTALAAIVAVSITTLSLTVVAEWQALVGSTWATVGTPNNSTVLQTGTGTLATGSYYVPAPKEVLAGSRQVRLVVVSGGASGGGAGVDSVIISYDFRAPTTSLGV
jgi:hypothetical protein